MEELDNIQEDYNQPIFTLNNIIRITINDESNKYELIVDYNKVSKTYDLSYHKGIDDKNKVQITKEEYDNFINRFYIIIEDWTDYYFGDKSFTWDIIIDEEYYRKISGKNGCPSNWNELINLLEEYELHFKKKINKEPSNIRIKKIDKERINKALAKKYTRIIKDEVDNILKEKGLLIKNENDYIPVVGSSAARWEIEEKILKERYNIEI